MPTGVKVHRLTDIDRIARTGICVACGPVKIKPKSKGKVWACRVSEESYRGARRWSPVRLKISSEELADKRRNAAGVCEICKKECERLVVDHDHKTQRFRGLLCNACNKALGFFRDDSKIIEAALEYINTRKAI